MLGVKEKTHTAKDYKLLPEGSPYQLIEGKLVMTPAPNPFHQIISANLFKTISKFTDEKGAGLTLYSPVDIYLDEENAFQPDIVFISKHRRDIIKDDGIHGAPELVVEILSPSTAYYDIKKKYKIYERSGVKEYWIVDPEMKSVEIYALGAQGAFTLTTTLTEKGAAKSGILTGLEMSLEEIFHI